MPSPPADPPRSIDGLITTGTSFDDAERSTRDYPQLRPLHPHPAFDLIVIGSGGGPFEDDLSSYFLKAHHSSWHLGFVALEAGSGLATISRLLQRPKEDHHPFYDFSPSHPSLDPPPTAISIYRHLTSFVISHTHLDHILSLILTAGTLAPHDPPKSVWATHSTISNLIQLFQGGLWPKLADLTGELPLWLRPLETAIDLPRTPIGPSLSLKAFDLIHHTHPESTSDSEPDRIDHHDSTAFLITNDANDQQFIFFGDLAPDSISHTQTNRRIWEVVAQSFKQNKLRAVFIECSYTTDRPPELLYGHLSPRYLFEELECLARFVDPDKESLHGVLLGLQVVIIHVKEDIDSSEGSRQQASTSRRQVILDEIMQLEEAEYRLGCDFSVANQGDRFQF